MATRQRPIHLHGPTGGTYCGTVVPGPRRALETTAYRSQATCPDCLDTLRPVPTRDALADLDEFQWQVTETAHEELAAWLAARRTRDAQ